MSEYYPFFLFFPLFLLSFLPHSLKKPPIHSSFQKESFPSISCSNHNHLLSEIFVLIRTVFLFFSLPLLSSLFLRRSLSFSLPGQFVQSIESSQIIPEASSNDGTSFAGQSGQHAGQSADQQQGTDYESQLCAEKEREISSLVETTPVPSLEESNFLEQLLKANGEGDGHGYGIRRRAKRYRRPTFLIKASIRKFSPDRLEKAKWLKEPSPEFCLESILIHDECETPKRYSRRSLGLRGRKGERRWSFSLKDGTCLLYNDPCPQLKRNSFTQLSQCIATCWRQFSNGHEAYY